MATDADGNRMIIRDGADRLVIGDFDGTSDVRDDVAFVLNCEFEGRGVSSNLVVALGGRDPVVFTGSPELDDVLGVGESVANFISVSAPVFSGGPLSITWWAYAPGDPQCCPTLGFRSQVFVDPEPRIGDTIPVRSSSTILVTAGADGVTRRIDGGPAEVVTGEAMRTAVGAPDGRVFMQRSDELHPDATPAPDTNILVWDPATGLITDAHPSAEYTNGIRLHDVAVVDGVTTVLYQRLEPGCFGAPRCDGTLWLLAVGDPGARPVQLDRRTSGRTCGPVVGHTNPGIYRQLCSAAAGPRSEFGSATFGRTVPCNFERPTAPCATGFTLEREGRFVAWIEGPPSAARLVILDKFERTRDEVRLGSPGDSIVGELDIAGVRISADGPVPDEVIFSVIASGVEVSLNTAFPTGS